MERYHALHPNQNSWSASQRHYLKNKWCNPKLSAMVDEKSNWLNSQVIPVLGRLTVRLIKEREQWEAEQI